MRVKNESQKWESKMRVKNEGQNEGQKWRSKMTVKNEGQKWGSKLRVKNEGQKWGSFGSFWSFRSFRSFASFGSLVYRSASQTIICACPDVRSLLTILCIINVKIEEPSLQGRSLTTRTPPLPPYWRRLSMRSTLSSCQKIWRLVHCYSPLLQILLHICMCRY